MAPGAVCPQGHTSASTDYCDTCGSPMSSSGAPSPAPTAAASAPESKPVGVVCPNCSVMNSPGALFCEACGYDYTTGTMPRPAEGSVLDLDSPLPSSDDAADAGPTAGDAPPPTVEAPEKVLPPPTPSANQRSDSGEATPSLDIDAPAPSKPGSQQSPAAASATTTAGDDAKASAVSPPDDAGATPPSQGSTPGGSSRAEETETAEFDWVLEIWIDPEWFALQESPDPLPSPGLPDVIPLRKRSLLIGRPSRSRNINPDIDCEPDTGISRRQAELSSDGTRWFIEDLGSANGTFIADASGGLPQQPIPTGRKRELSSDERIYMGAWTRLVLRRATPEEKDVYAAV